MVLTMWKNVTAVKSHDFSFGRENCCVIEQGQWGENPFLPVRARTTGFLTAALLKCNKTRARHATPFHHEGKN